MNQWRAPNLHDAPQAQHDDHRRSPLLPPIVVLVLGLVVVCGALAWLVLR